MEQTKYNKDRYKKMVEKASPNSKLLRDCIRAFIVGGLISDLGQFILDTLMNIGLTKDNASAYTSVILIFLGVLLTGLGIYPKIGKFAGAGSAVPITGFANSVASPAIEFKKEGMILGMGAKMFIVAGPVIVYGTLTSMAVGLIYFISKAVF